MKLKQINRHIYITNSDLVNATIDGIYIDIKSDNFDFIKRPRLYYSDDNGHFCFEVMHGWEQRIFSVDDYGKTWLFKDNVEVVENDYGR